MIGFVTDPVLGECLLLDSSSLEPFTACPFKGYIEVIRKRKSALADPALRYGDCVHHALSYRYKRLFHTPVAARTDDWWQQLLNKQITVLERRFAATPCENEEWRNFDSASALLQLYHRENLNEPYTIAALNGSPFVEKAFAIKCNVIDGITIIYIGKIDLVVSQPNGQLFVVDHKTTSVLGDTYWSAAAVAEQQRGYCFALAVSNYSQPSGYFINVLATRKPTKTGKSIEVERRIFYLEDNWQSLWYQNFLQQAEIIIHNYRRNQHPRYHNSCVTKYGLCKYYDLCRTPANCFEDELLNSGLYIENKWTPLKSPTSTPPHKLLTTSLIS